MSEGGPYHIKGKHVSRWEYLTECHGEVIADAAERGRYGYSDEGWGYLYLRTDSIIPRPERVSIERVFPIDVSALADPATHFRGLASWTRFLQWSPQIQDNDAAVTERDYSYPAKHFDSKAPKRVGEQYDRLRSDHFAGGKPRAGAVADLRALKNEARESLQHWAKQIGSKLESLRKVVAVLFLETWWAMDVEPETPWEDLPEERRNRLDSLEALFVSRWRDAIFGASRTWAIGRDITNWSWGWEDAPEVLYELQGSRILSLWDRRDAIIDEVFPVEVQRMACENILAKIVRGEEVGPWSKKDEESLLPPREDFVCQSREARRDIFDLYDALNEGGYREEEWTIHTDIYRVLAKREAETKSPNTSRSKFIAGEVERLALMVKRTLEWQGANGFPGDNAVLSGTSEEAAKHVCDWLFEIGCSHKSEWMRKMA